MIEKTLTSEKIYNGKVIDVERDEVEIATGKNSMREVVRHSGGVVIVATVDNKLLMVNQFRYPIYKDELELPAGKLEVGENPDLACKRELEEETGYVTDKWTSLGYIYTSPGFSDEKLYLYKAENLRYTHIHPDDGEILENISYPLEEVFEMIKNGKINDAKTICALSRAYKL